MPDPTEQLIRREVREGKRITAGEGRYLLDALDAARDRIGEATALLAWWADESDLADSDDAVSVMDSAIRDFLAAAHA
jgi:hypothetical protein